MSAPFSGTTVLLVARFDEMENSHNVLRRRALERLGCSVVGFDPAQAGLLDRLARADVGKRLAKALEQHRPELVLVIRGESIGTEVLAQLRRQSSAKWVNWFPDDIRGLGLIQSLAGAYDHVFVTGTDVAAHLRVSDPGRVSYLPLACDPSVHRPMRARGPFRANVVFVGAATPRREHLLNELVEFGLAIWGPGWRKTPLKDYCRGELPTIEDYVRAYAGASVAVNIHQSVDADPAHDSRGCNQRLFELAGIGIPQVVDARGDLAPLFEENTQVWVYQNAAELKGLVKRGLQEDAYRERLGAAARQRALREHTYMHRMMELLRTAKDAKPAL